MISGFIPSTLADDGDPLDVLVHMDAPAHVGCLFQVRLIGVMSAEQVKNGNKQRNDRLLGVATHSYDHEDVKTIDDVGKTILSQVEEFFVSDNKQRGKTFRITVRASRKKPSGCWKPGANATKPAIEPPWGPERYLAILTCANRRGPRLKRAAWEVSLTIR